MRLNVPGALTGVGNTAVTKQTGSTRGPGRAPVPLGEERFALEASRAGGEQQTRRQVAVQAAGRQARGRGLCSGAVGFRYGVPRSH